MYHCQNFNVLDVWYLFIDQLYSKTYHCMLLLVNDHRKYIIQDSWCISFISFGEIWNFNPSHRTHIMSLYFVKLYIYIYARPIFQ
jgi:hypothetical protein